MIPGRRSLVLALALLTGLPAGAGATAYSQVLRTYELRGTIPPCTFTAPQLSAALKGVDVYGQQYFADFTDAIQSALSQRAAGACQAGGARISPSAPGTNAGPPLRLGPVTAATHADPPLALIAAAALALAALLWAAGGTLRRMLGFGRGTGGAWRHLWAESGWRLGGVWADFTDWLRSAGLSRRSPRPPG